MSSGPNIEALVLDERFDAFRRKLEEVVGVVFADTGDCSSTTRLVLELQGVIFNAFGGPSPRLMMNLTDHLRGGEKPHILVICDKPSESSFEDMVNNAIQFGGETPFDQYLGWLANYEDFETFFKEYLPLKKKNN